MRMFTKKTVSFFFFFFNTFLGVVVVVNVSLVARNNGETSSNLDSSINAQTPFRKLSQAK